MASFGPDGGIVSTAPESMIFVKAFYNGKLFDTAKLPALYTWNKVMFPLEYGVGMMRFKLPTWMTGFRKFPACIGHSGLSGAFAWYVPEKNLYITGTVNQLHKPGTSFRMLIRVLSSVK